MKIVVSLKDAVKQQENPHSETSKSVKNKLLKIEDTLSKMLYTHR